MYVCMRVSETVCMYVCVSACECVCVLLGLNPGLCVHKYWAIFYLREVTVSFSVSIYFDKIFEFRFFGGGEGNLT